MPDLPILAARIRAALALRQATHAALAERTGRSLRTVGNWVAGRTEPEASEVALIGRALDVSTDYLLGLVDHEQGLRPGMWVIDADSAQVPAQGERWAFQIPARPRLVGEAEKLRIESAGEAQLRPRPRGRPRRKGGDDGHQ